MQKRDLLILLAVLAWAVSFCVPAHAQFAAMTGVVKGSDGQPVAGAQILIENIDRNITAKVKTNKNGRFAHAALVSFNRHNVTLFVNGRKRSVRPGIRLGGPGSETTVDFDLQASRKRAGGRAGGSTPLTAKQRKDLEKQLDKDTVERGKMGQLNKAFGDGVAALQVRNYDLAIAQLEEAAQLGPRQPPVLAHLGEAYLEAGKARRGTESRDLFQKSVEAYGKAVALKPEEAGYHNNFGLALAFSGDLERAEAELSKSAELDPSNGGRYFFNLGAVLTNNAQIKGAVLAFRKATELDPEYSMAWYQLGVSLSAEATLDEKTGKITPVPGTVEALQKYIELEPNGAYAAGAKSLIESFDVKVETSFKKEKKKRRRRR
jgi:tetratricopeptide (TPR) repeat protein